MKQHSIGFLAPFATVFTLLVKFVHFSSKQIMAFLSMPQRMMGKWRLYWNYCPECNSCAPKIHHCEVCNADTKSFYNWNEEVKQTWWKKYTEKHHIAM